MLEVRGHEGKGPFVFVQYRECISPRNITNKGLGCLNVLCSFDENTDHSSAGRSCISWNDSLSTGEGFVAEPLCQIKETFHVKRGNFGLPLFSDGVAWPFRHFHINRFYKLMS